MFASFVAAEGPNTELAWLLYAGLGFFLFVILTGWLTSPKQTREARKSAVQGKRSASGVAQRRGRAPGAVKDARRKSRRYRF